jgi:hypothetical protein
MTPGSHQRRHFDRALCVRALYYLLSLGMRTPPNFDNFEVRLCEKVHNQRKLLTILKTTKYGCTKRSTINANATLVFLFWKSRITAHKFRN